MERYRPGERKARADHLEVELTDIDCIDASSENKPGGRTPPEGG
ncbi:hypothetical protein [Streptomyces nojiriensis]